jgi:hypothetical protein
MAPYQNRMFWQSVVTCISLFIVNATARADEKTKSIGGSDEAAAVAADRLRDALTHVTSVSFYFQTSTEKHPLSAEQLRERASIFVRRRCGGNCESFMRDVTSHLAASVSSNCSPGQENALIDIGSVSVLYSHSGRTIKLDGHCFFNTKKVTDIIKADHFIFH